MPGSRACGKRPKPSRGEPAHRLICHAGKAVVSRAAGLDENTPLLADTKISDTMTIFTNELTLTNFSAAQAGDYTFILSNCFLVTNGPIVTMNFLGAPAAFTATLRVRPAKTRMSSAGN